MAPPQAAPVLTAPSLGPHVLTSSGGKSSRVLTLEITLALSGFPVVYRQNFRPVPELLTRPSYPVFTLSQAGMDPGPRQLTIIPSPSGERGLSSGPPVPRPGFFLRGGQPPLIKGRRFPVEASLQDCGAWPGVAPSRRNSWVHLLLGP